ncbi:MAG: hypothetical protein ACYS8X_10385 [Planctomycetota bacterium]|jgi:uncharacterized membrane protein
MGNWKLIISAVVVIAVLAGAVVAVVTIWPDAETRAAAQAERKSAAPSAPGLDEPQEVITYLASEKFEAMGQAKKEAYYRKLAEAPDDSLREALWGQREAMESLDEEQRARLRQHVGSMMQIRMETQLDRYFAMTPEEKKAYLDERIDRWSGHRRERGAGRSGDSNTSSTQRRREGGRRGGRHQFGPEHLDRIIQSVPPERRAKFVQFMKDMRDRRAERARE